MAQQIKIDIVADTQQLQQGLNQVNQQIGGLDASVKKIQGLTSAFVGIGVAAKGFGVAGGLINKTTDAASDLEETLSKTNVLFGKSAKEVVKFTKTAAKEFGQSQQQALDAAATFGIFGKSAGLAGKDLTKFSTGFVGLASDLASFNNTSPEEAINAIGSALRGEAEPLRKYGVLLNDATLKQAALELGIYDGVGALTAQQKVLAAQKVIYEQTGDAQGDFARTSDGLANSQRILEATQADLNTNIGQTFLPIMKQVNAIMLVAVEAFSALPDPVQKIIVAVGLLVATVGPLIILFGSIKTAIIALELSMISMSTVMAALPWVALIAAIVLVITHWDDIREVVDVVWKKIQAFGDYIKPFLEATWKFIANVFENALNLIKTAVTSYFDGYIKVIKFFTEFVVKAISEAWEIARDAVTNSMAAIKNVIESVWLAIAEQVVDITVGIRDQINNAWTAVKETTIALFNKVKEYASTIWNGIKNIVTGAVQSIITAVSRLFADMIQVGVDIAKGIWQGLQQMGPWLREKIRGYLGDNIVGFTKFVLGINSPSKVFGLIGENIAQGLVGGLQTNRVPTVSNSSASSSGAINVTINAGLGADPYEIGRQVTTALNKYGNVSRAGR